jgi:hypothetical protein
VIVDCVDRSPRGDMVAFRSDDEHWCMNVLERGRSSVDDKVAGRELVMNAFGRACGLSPRSMP